MKLTINGESQELPAVASLQELLEVLGYAGKKVAVAHNGDFVPRTQHENTSLKEGDELELLSPMQGG